MKGLLKEECYAELMGKIAEPYLDARGGSEYTQREAGKKIHYLRYMTEEPKAVVLVSHGFTEFAEKYKEILYYFLKEGFHVYMPEHCGHGKSYRLTEDPSLVHVDHFQRYVEDLYHITEIIQREQPDLPIYLYGHSMGGGIAAATAAMHPKAYQKVILTSPMIRPLTGGIPWGLTKLIDGVMCGIGKAQSYVPGAHPFTGPEKFETSASTSRARFQYYVDKQAADVDYHTCAASYGWLGEAIRLNTYLQKEGYRKIEAPVLLIQAGQDYFVSNEQQKLFIQKMKDLKKKAEITMFQDTKHEIFNAVDAVAGEYWNKVFDFLTEENV
ncbi:MAG: alpha/beta hydrolase [Eubacteriales bacterium]|nr:alpha/beta hydrolase [Eubacteriales bacterium]